MKYTPEKLVKGMVKIATLPTIYIKIDKAINDVRTSNKHLARIINEDAAVTARVLKFANSALFNFPSRVDDISHAITIIGIQQLRDLILASSVLDIFKDVPSELVTMESFWRHSVATGVTARILAAQRREANIERFFMVGLLHDIGRLIMFSEMPSLMGEMLSLSSGNSQLLYKVEQDTLGFDHAILGGALLEEWGLPNRIADAVKFHHSPDSATKYPVDASIIHIADVIVNSMQLGSSGEKFVPPLSVWAWDRSALVVNVVPMVLEQLQKQYQDAINFIMGDVV